MSTLNRIVLVGRLTKDPESKYTPNGVAVAQFTIAVDRFTKNAETGEKETDFIPVVAWRRTAEFITQYVTKGRLVSVDGRLQVRSWVTQDGSRRYMTEVVAENVDTLDRPRDGEGPPHHADDPAYAGAAKPEAMAAEVGTDDNDPFADD